MFVPICHRTYRHGKLNMSIHSHLVQMKCCPLGRGYAALNSAGCITATVCWLTCLSTHIQWLQPVQNAAARLIFNPRWCDRIIVALICHHWLRMPEQITFKVAMLMYLALHGSAPPYLVLSFTCHTDPGSGPFSEQLYVLTVSQRSEVVPLQWDQRCNIVCQVTLHQPHCWCQCSRTGWRHFK